MSRLSMRVLSLGMLLSVSLLWGCPEDEPVENNATTNAMTSNNTTMTMMDMSMTTPEEMGVDEDMGGEEDMGSGGDMAAQMCDPTAEEAGCGADINCEETQVCIRDGDGNSCCVDGERGAVMNHMEAGDGDGGDCFSGIAAQGAGGTYYCIGQSCADETECPDGFKSCKANVIISADEDDKYCHPE